jgi:hypothetical protein
LKICVAYPGNMTLPETSYTYVPYKANEENFVNTLSRIHIHKVCKVDSNVKDIFMGTGYRAMT